MDGMHSFLIMTSMMGIILFLYSYQLKKMKFLPVSITLIFSLSLFIASIFGKEKWLMMGLYSVSLFIATSIAYLGVVFFDLYKKIFIEQQIKQKEDKEGLAETG